MRIPYVLPIAGLSLAAMLTPVLVSAQQPAADAQPAQSTDQKAPAKPADKPTQAGDKKAVDNNTAAKPTADTTPDGRKLEKLEDPEPPSIKIGKPPGEHKVTEIRDDSGPKEVKVETGVSTYYVKPNTQVGNAQPGDAQSSFNRGAEWKVMEFNLGDKKKKPENDKSDDADSKK